MPLKNIANEDLTLGHDADSATLSVATPASIKYKANNKGIYRGPITIIVSNATKGSCQSGVGSVIINGSGKIKNDNQSVLREGDSGTGNIIGVQGQNPCNFMIEIEVDDAGQTKYKST